jgi:Acyl-CoA dehydrogenase, C-terminal domain
VCEALAAVWDSGLRGEPATAEMRINARLAAVTALQKCTEIVRAAYDASGASAVRSVGVLQRLCTTPAACNTTYRLA